MSDLGVQVSKIFGSCRFSIKLAAGWRTGDALLLELKGGQGRQCLRLFYIRYSRDTAGRQCLFPLAQRLHSSKQCQNMVYLQPESQGWIGDRGTEERREWKYCTWEIKGT